MIDLVAPQNLAHAPRRVLPHLLVFLELRSRPVGPRSCPSTAATPSAPPILTACDGDGALGCYRVPGDAA